MASEKPQPPARPVRVLRIGLMALALLPAMLLVLAGWLSGSESGARAAFSMLASTGAVRAEGVHGRLLGPLQVDRLWLDSESQLITLENLRLNWQPRALLERRLHVNSLRIGKLVIAGKEHEKKESKGLPDNIALPFPLRMDSVQVDGGELAQGPVTMARLGTLAFNLDFDGARYLLRVERFGASSASDAGSLAANLEGEATLSVAKPYALRGELASGGEAVFRDQTIGAGGRIGVEGSLAELVINADLALKESKINGRLVLRPFAEQVLGLANLTAQAVDLSGFGAELPGTSLDIKLSAQENGAGELLATNSAAGRYDEKKMPLADLRIAFRQRAGQVDFDRIAATLGSAKRPAGAVSGSGRYAGGALKLDLDLKSVDLRQLDQRMQPTRLGGSIGILHQSGRQEFALDLTEPLNKQTVALAAHAVLANSSLAVDRAELRLGNGRIQASGHLDLAGRQSFSARAEVARFRLKDVGKFPQLPDLFLNGQLSLRGERQPQLVADLAFDIKDSRLEGQPLQGQAKAQLRADSIDISRFQLIAGANRFGIEGRLTQDQGQLSFTIAAPRLEQLGAGFGGALEADGVARGSFSRPLVHANWRGSNIRLPGQVQLDSTNGKAEVQVDRSKPFSIDAVNADAYARGLRSGEQQVGELSARLQFSPQENAPLNLVLRGQAAMAGGVRADSFSATAGGTTGRHALRLTLAEPGQNWELAASGGLKGLNDAPQWQGNIERLDAAGRMGAKLAAPAPLLVSQQRVQLDRFRLDASFAQISVEQFLRDPRGIVTRGNIARLDVAQLLKFSAKDSAVKTDLQLGGEWNVNITDVPSGTISIRRERGDVVMQGSRPVALGLSSLQASATLSDSELTMQLRAEGKQLGLIDASGRTSTAGGSSRLSLPPNAPLSATINLNVPSLGWAGPLVSPTTIVEGRLQSAIKVAGTVSQPLLSGQVTGNALRLLSVDTGVDLRQGTLEGEFQDAQMVLRSLRFQSPDGYLVASGRIDLANRQPNAQVTVKAERFAVLDRSDRRLRVSGESQISWRQARAAITGAFTVNSGFFDISSTSMPKLSNDVVIVGRSEEQSEEKGFPATVDISISLGEGIALRGRGLNAMLAGQVRIASEAGQPLRARGTVQVVKGTFAAYGRELAIEQGVVRFNGPVNNPALDILAMRRGQEVEAGVAVRGTVLAPRVTLVSEPPVSEAEKLSWLVLGRGLGGVGEGEMGTLQSAAGALLSQGAAAGVQSQIAKVLGLDELSLGKTDDSLQERIVTLGKQVSSRLYVSLERGLETASSVLHLRYTLNPKLTVEAEAGTRSALSLFYNIAFD